LEAKLVFQDLVRNNTPSNRFVNPGFTYLVPSLGTHYGISGTFSSAGTRVATEDRGGMLMLGAFLTATSPPDITSPIRRGKFVQNRVLCKLVPAPPAELGEVIAQSEESLPPDATVKQRLSLHRNTQTVCYGCHQFMDPIGLGLEGFDPKGKTRTVYPDGKPVEADSELLGVPFQDFKGLNGLLSTMAEAPRCASEKVAVLALGRVVASSPGNLDQALVDELSAKVNGEYPSFRDVLKRMVRSKAFRTVFHEVTP